MALPLRVSRENLIVEFRPRVGLGRIRHGLGYRVGAELVECYCSEPLLKSSEPLRKSSEVLVSQL